MMYQFCVPVFSPLKFSFAMMVLFCCALQSIAQDNADNKLAAPQDEKEDTLVWYSNLDAGFLSAKKNNKFPVVYYEPEDCTACTYKADKLIKELKSSYNYFDTKTFNGNYVLILAQPKDTMLLKTAGVAAFPGAAVFTNDKKILHYKYDIELNKLLVYLGVSYDFGNIAQKIAVQNYTAYAAEKIKQSRFDTALILKYLSFYSDNQQDIYQLQREQKDAAERNAPLPTVAETLPPSPDTADAAIAPVDIIQQTEPPGQHTTKGKQKAVVKHSGKNKKNSYQQRVTVKRNVPPPEIPAPVMDTTLLLTQVPYMEAAIIADTTAAAFNFNIDTSFIIRALDSLVSKSPAADSATAALILKITETTDEYYCPFFVSKLLSANDTLFTPSVSFNYLFTNYGVLKNMKLLRKGYSSYYNLYEVLSKRLNRFIRYNGPGNMEAIKKALLFQSQFLLAIPELEHLEKPLFISNILSYNSQLKADTLFSNVAIPYLDKLTAAKPTLNIYINTLAKAIGKNFEREMDYVVWNNSPEQPGYRTDNGYRYYYPVYLKYKFGLLLNDAAWYFYQHNADTASTGRALRYAVTVLQLAPFNPFYLDTYAHLLFKKGDKKMAIIYQQKAVTEAVKMQKDYMMDAEQAVLFKNELAKMKTGKL
jgi:hypothetical protein